MSTSYICPSCGGQFVRAGETSGGFSVGKAVAGQAVFGAGGAAAGLLGNKQITMRCSKCGYTKNVSPSMADTMDTMGGFQSTMHSIRKDMYATSKKINQAASSTSSYSKSSSQQYAQPATKIPAQPVVKKSEQAKIGESLTSVMTPIQAQYNRALHYIEVGNRADLAVPEFEALGDYPNAKNLLLVAKYHAAVGYIQSRKNLNLAISYLEFLEDCQQIRRWIIAYNDMIANQGDSRRRKIPDIGDSANVENWLCEARYILATQLIAKKRHQDAVELYKKIGDYRDAATLAKQYSYALAEAHLNVKNWDNAIAYFKDAVGYKDAETRAIDLQYRVGIAYYNQDPKNYAKALPYFEELGDYQQARELTVTCKYYVGTELVQQKTDLATALKYFEEICDFRNSADWLIETRYNYAIQLVQKHNKFEEALSQFEQVESHHNTDQWIKYCKYHIANKLVESKSDWQRAIALYEEIGEYNDASARLSQARNTSSAEHKAKYDCAMAIMAEKSDWDKAIAILEEISHYEDAKEQIKSCKYQKAESFTKSPNEDLEQALARFTELGDYMDSQDNVKKISYELGNQYMSEYSKAKEYFIVAGDYKDASLAVILCEAMELLHVEKDYLAAIKLIKTAKGHKLAGEYLANAQLMYGINIAQNFRANNQWDEAIEAFRKYGDNKVCFDNMNSTCYQAGTYYYKLLMSDCTIEDACQHAENAIRYFKELHERYRPTPQHSTAWYFINSCKHELAAKITKSMDIHKDNAAKNTHLWDKALKYLDEIGHFPGSDDTRAELLNNYGIFLRIKGDLVSLCTAKQYHSDVIETTLDTSTHALIARQELAKVEQKIAQLEQKQAAKERKERRDNNPVLKFFK